MDGGTGSSSNGRLKSLISTSSNSASERCLANSYVHLATDSPTRPGRVLPMTTAIFNMNLGSYTKVMAPSCSPTRPLPMARLIPAESWFRLRGGECARAIGRGCERDPNSNRMRKPLKQASCALRLRFLGDTAPWRSPSAGMAPVHYWHRPPLARSRCHYALGDTRPRPSRTGNSDRPIRAQCLLQQLRRPQDQRPFAVRWPMAARAKPRGPFFPQQTGWWYRRTGQSSPFARGDICLLRRERGIVQRIQTKDRAPTDRGREPSSTPHAPLRLCLGE